MNNLTQKLSSSSIPKLPERKSIPNIGSVKDLKKSGETKFSTDYFRYCTIQILQGENLFVNKMELSSGNPYVRIKAITKRGEKIRYTKIHIKEIYPVWTEEIFTFYGLSFPIQCECFSHKSPLTKKGDSIEGHELIGKFFIDKEHLSKYERASIQRWFPLEPPDNDNLENQPRILVDISVCN